MDTEYLRQPGTQAGIGETNQTEMTADIYEQIETIEKEAGMQQEGNSGNKWECRRSTQDRKKPNRYKQDIGRNTNFIQL